MLKTSGLLFTDTVAFTPCPHCKAVIGKDCESPTTGKVSWTPHIERLKAFMQMPEYNKENYAKRSLFGTNLDVLGKGNIPTR